MKKIPIGLIIAVLSLAYIGTCHAATPTDLYNEETCYYGWGDEVVPGYHNYDGKVYYFDCPLEGVDWKSLKPLTVDGKELFGYVMDKNYIYYKTRRLDGLSPDDFRIKQMADNNEVILYDDDTIYFDAVEVSDSGMDVETFRMENGAYRDDQYLYMRGQTPDTLDGWVQNFEFGRVEGGEPDNYAHGYKITPSAVYWYGKKIEEADPGSFETMYDGFAKDKNNVFSDGKVMYGADVESFNRTAPKGIDIYIYVDKNRSYYGVGLKTIDEVKKETPESANSLNQSIKSALLDYKQKYPGYTPQPAIDPENPPQFPLLSRWYDRLTDMKYLNPPFYYTIILGPFVILAGIFGFVFRKRFRRR